ncbi:hypothetical protein IV203_031108 [Nitzschia inconspicua]|uniref:Uncharacterized protein n=1 Tax=Nitzschia inconspicua TaxID=303405 RepID=A0A9K3Q2U4_9STRA|nr:hypothetical protein IV203_031108 [Nitzschia inconspicua]
MSFHLHSTAASPQKRNLSGNKFVNPGIRSRTSSMQEARSSRNATVAGPTKLTYSQRKVVEKEEEDYERMFQLFDSKAEIEYLNSWEDDKFAASVYGDAKITASSKQKSSNSSDASIINPHTSGYNFDQLLKNEPNYMGFHESWRKY